MFSQMFMVNFSPEKDKWSKYVRDLNTILLEQAQTLNGEWRSTDFDADTSSCEQLPPPWSYSITIYSLFGAQKRKCKNAKLFTRIIRNYAVITK